MNNYNNMNYFIPNEYMMNDINSMKEYAKERIYENNDKTIIIFGTNTEKTLHTD